MEKKQNELITLDASETDKKVRVGMHLISQKFGIIRNGKVEQQLGLDLSLNESKALHALLKLLDKTSYKGNMEGRSIANYENRMNYSGVLPRISCTLTEFLEAYGLERKLTNRGFNEFSPQLREEAMYALRSLARNRYTFVYKRETFGKKEKAIDRIEAEVPLISVIKGYFGLTEKENDQLDRGIEDENTQKKLLIGIEFGPLFVDQIEGYFVLLPGNLYSDIKRIVGKKYSSYIPLFIEWLIMRIRQQEVHKTPGAELKISTEKLANILRMDALVKEYSWNKIREILDQCYQVAKELGYISKWGREENLEIIKPNCGKSLPEKVGFSTTKSRILYQNKSDSLPEKVGTQKRPPLQTLTN